MLLHFAHTQSADRASREIRISSSMPCMDSVLDSLAI